MAHDSDTTLAEALTQVGAHQHLCILYETAAEQCAAVVPFLRLGLERGERCLYIADDRTTFAVTETLRGGGIDVEAQLAADGLILANSRETYLRRGYFDPDAMLEFLGEATEQASRAGFRALRVTGEMTWALGANPGSERLIEYEAKLNRFLSDQPALALCQYHRRRFPPALIQDILRTHPLMSAGGLVCRNFYYIPPEEFLTPDQPAQEVERLLIHLQARERSEQALVAANRCLQREVRIREQAEAELRTVYELSTAAERAATVEAVCEHALDALERALGANRASLLLCDDGVMRFKAWRRLSEAYRQRVEGHSPWPAHERYPKPVLIDNVGHADLGPLRQVVLREGIRALAFIPLVTQGRLLGKFTVYFDTPHRFTAREVQLAQTIAGHIAHALERQRAEEALRHLNCELERRLHEMQTLFNVIPIGIGVAEDAVCRRIRVNPRFAEFLGIPPEANASLSALPEERPTLFRVEQGGRELPPEELPMQYAAAHGVDVHDVELDVVHQDGRVLKLLCQASPLFDEAGKVRGCVGAFLGITARQRAEEALYCQSQLTKTITDNAASALFMIDTQGRGTFVNPAGERMTGYTSDDIIGQVLHDLIHHTRPDGTPYPMAECPIDRALPEHIVIRGHEDVFLRKDGTFFPVRCAASPIIRHGVAIGTVIEVQDITEQKQAEQQLSAALAAKEVLLREIHHRVKNNLQVICSLLSLQSGTIQDAVLRELFQESERRIHAMALVHETLYQAAGLAHFSLGRYLQTLSAQLIDAFGIDTHRIALTLEVEDIPLPLDAAMPCGLILNELLSNALKHAFPDGRRGDVALMLKALPHGHATLRVCDTGVGFPNGLDFRHADSLGLQLVCALAEQLRGTLTMERDGGTAFTLTFLLPDVETADTIA
jgi:PAS domain S-box-containing protein